MRAITFELMSSIEQKMRTGRWVEINEFLKSAKVEDYDASTLVGILTISWHGRANLSERAEFYKRAEIQLTKVLGEERTKKLLANRN